MDEPTRLQFGPSQYKIASYHLAKRPQKAVLKLPPASSLMRAEVLPQDPHRIVIFAMVPIVTSEDDLVAFDVLVTYEGVPFGVEEEIVPAMLPDGSVGETTYAHVHHLGFWSEVAVDTATGGAKLITGHILEVVEDEPEVPETKETSNAAG